MTWFKPYLGTLVSIVTAGYLICVPEFQVTVLLCYFITMCILGEGE